MTVVYNNILRGFGSLERSAALHGSTAFSSEFHSGYACGTCPVRLHNVNLEVFTP